MVSTKKNKLASLRDPNTLKSGHVKKLSSGKVYVVKRNSEGVARYVKARPDDVKCSKTLKQNVSEMLNEVKKNKNKNKQSYSQALAIAYSKTQKKYPKCQLVQKTNNNTNKTKKLTKSKHIQNGGKKRVKLQRKIIKLLIKRNYIRTQDGKCAVVKGDNIKSLYDDFEKEASTALKNIKNKKQDGKQTVDNFIKFINILINKCNIKLPTIDVAKYPFSVINNSINIRPNILISNDAQYEYMLKLYKFIKEKLKLLSI